MDRIKELLKQLGGSEDLTNQIVESLQKFTDDQKKNLEGEYKARLAQAKKVCMEEMTRFKADLARKTQIFFETRVDKIEQQMAKQVAIRESAAERKLKQVASLLEGISVNADGEADLQAIKTTVAQLREKVKVLGEERTVAVSKANRAYAIAEKYLKRNKELETTIAENKDKAAKQPEKEATAVVTEGKIPPATISRTAATPQTTRVTSESTVAAKPKPTETTAVTIPTGSLRGWDPNSIANQME